MYRLLTSRGLSSQAIIAAFFIYVLGSLLTGYLPGSDEYLQVQASLNLRADLGYTMLQHLYDLPEDCYQDCYPDHVYLSAYPPGYSLLIYLAALFFDHYTSIILIKFTSIILAYLSWSYFLVNYLCDNKYNSAVKLVVAVFLTLISYQSTTDVFLTGCIPFFFHVYRELMSHKLRVRTILLFNLATSFALLMKYQALFIVFPLYPIIVAVLFSRRQFNICFLFIIASFIPVLTTATYLGFSYNYTGQISTQIVNNWQIPVLSITAFTNLFKIGVWSYLNVIFNESFLITKYFSKLLGSLGVSHDIRLIGSCTYFFVFGTSLIYGVKTILKNNKRIFLSFTLIICVSNSLFLLLLHVFSPLPNSDFNPVLYFRYHTFLALLLLLTIIVPYTKENRFFSRLIAIQFFAFTVVFVSIKAIEAKHSLLLSADVNSYLRDIEDQNENHHLLFFSDHRIWRSDWSTDNLYRYRLVDFLDLPQALPSKTAIVLVCSKNNRGLLGQKVSEGCSNILLYSKKLTSTVTEIEQIDAGDVIILKGFI